MLRPFLLVGVGGSGGKTLRVVRQDLLRRLKQTGEWSSDDLPAAWQFIHIDVPTHADGADIDLPDQLPDRQYKGLVATGVDYATIDTSVRNHGGKLFTDAAATWRPNPNAVNVSPSKGAGQFRTLGRIISIAGLKQIDDAVRRARAAMTGTNVVGEMQEVTRILGGRKGTSVGDPTVIIVSSIAGGTGAGTVIDVCDVVRSLADKWANDSVGFLYAPDVFDHLQDEARRGVRANALGTMAELLNGYWNTEGASEATTALFSAHGITLNNTSRRSGPRYSFLIGAQNATVTYKSQNDIYRAMGRSIASWMASEKLQDSFTAYLDGNWAQTTSATTDNLGLHDSGQETPISAIGSARVGLGRERFGVYAAQNLARTIVDRIVEDHERHRGKVGDERTSKQIIRDVAGDAFPGFLKNSGLHERGLEQNDIVDALKARDLKAQGAALVAKVKAKVGELVNTKKGARPTEVSERVLGTVRDSQRRFLQGLTETTQAQARDWTVGIQRSLKALVATQIGLSGGPVTEALLGLLTDELHAVRDEMRAEAVKWDKWSQEKAAAAANAFQGHERALISATTDAMLEKAINDAVTSVMCIYEAELRRTVERLIPDLIQGLVEPMREAVKHAHEVLALQRSSATSEVGKWPDGDIIPVGLLPAPNEFLLEEPAEYPEILARLLQRTINADESQDARREAELQVLIGTDESRSEKQQLIASLRPWVPQDLNLRTEVGAVPQRAQFTVESAPESVLGRAECWLAKEGTAVGRYMSQGLRDYLSPDRVEPKVHDTRLNVFEGKLIAALNASAPLVKLNPAVLVNVHDEHRMTHSSHFGEIPLPEGSAAREVFTRVLQSRNEWREDLEKAFTDGRGGFIDVFTHLNTAYEPVVFDSLMRPIASDWGQKSKTPEGRAEFWRWRRCRPLTEFVPVSTSVLAAMVKGWFVASRLGHLDLKPASAAIYLPDTDTTPSVWAPFPTTMLRPEALNGSEGIAVILESMMLALVEVNTREKVDPVLPYRRLRELGEGSGVGSALNPELQAWILEGSNRLPLLEPWEESPESRKKKVLDEIREVSERYGKHFADIQKNRKDPRDFPPTWDLRKLIDVALSELALAVESLETLETGTTGWA